MNKMQKQKQKIAHLSIKLPYVLKSKLQKLGKEKQRTTHWLMKEAIKYYLTAEEKLIKTNKQKTYISRELETEEIITKAKKKKEVKKN